MYKEIITVLTVLSLTMGMGAAGLIGGDYTPRATQTYDNITDVDIGCLADRYDRDGDGSLSVTELQVVYYDYLHMSLNDAEIRAFVAVLGEEPVPIPELNTPAPVVKDVPEPNYPCDYENIEDVVGYIVCNPGHGDDVQYRANWFIVSFYCDDVIGIMTHPNIRRIKFKGDRNTCWYRDTANPTIVDLGEGNQALPYSPCDTSQ